MYMGEIVRLMMEKFTEEGILFNGKGSHQLSTRGIFDTMYISTIEAADVGKNAENRIEFKQKS